MTQRRSHSAGKDLGVSIRAATDADLPLICALVVDRGEPADGVDLRLIADTAGLGGTAVAEVDGVIAATATLLDEQLCVGAITVPAGQIELVATDRAYEHRGLIRALMSWCHERSAARGHLAQVMVGIPNFYRQFGYSYGMPMHAWATVETSRELSTGDTVRTAGIDDIGAMSALQQELQATFDVSMPHQPTCWECLVRRDGSVQWLVERDGAPVGVARLVTDDDAVWLGEIATRDESATHALVHAAAVMGIGGGRPTYATARRRVPGLQSLLHSPTRPDWYYVRVPRFPDLLEALRPELTSRLREALPDAHGEALLSLWSSHVRFRYGPDGVRPIVAGGPFQAPVSSGGSGLPPDAVPALLFGCGAPGLEDRYADAFLGRQAELMAALFPAQESDLLTYYLPA